jgi:hypothetical protein
MAGDLHWLTWETWESQLRKESNVTGFKFTSRLLSTSSYIVCERFSQMMARIRLKLSVLRCEWSVNKLSSRYFISRSTQLFSCCSNSAPSNKNLLIAGAICKRIMSLLRNNQSAQFFPGFLFLIFYKIFSSDSVYISWCQSFLRRHNTDI